jgi:hypothetical protein
VSVLARKIPPEQPLRGSANRETVIQQVAAYLYGNDPDQGVAEVRMLNAERRMVNRRELVTGAVIEQALSAAIDDAVRQTAVAGALLGIDAEGIIAALQEQFVGLARSLRPHNLQEHVPDWFSSDGSIHVENVRPLIRSTRRPRSVLVR